jgi:hypothetical protein
MPVKNTFETYYLTNHFVGLIALLSIFVYMAYFVFVSAYRLVRQRLLSEHAPLRLSGGGE